MSMATEPHPEMEPEWRARFPNAAVFEKTTFIPRPLGEVFDFFSRAENLEALTPPTVQFEILTPLPIEMRVGAGIDYRIKIHGIPVKWKTEIIVWEPGVQFVDVQLKGPYRLWHHRHTFTEVDGGVSMVDTVHYRSPLHTLLVPLFIRKDIEKIFAHRTTALAELFA